MGKTFNKGLSEDDKKEVLFKRLVNIKDNNEKQLQVVKYRGEKQLKELKNIYKNKTLRAIDKISKNEEANKLLPKFKKIDKELKKAELVCIKTNGTKYDFNRFLFPYKFIGEIYYYEITLSEAINDETELKILINKLDNYSPLKIKKKKRRKHKSFRICKKIVWCKRFSSTTVLAKQLYETKDKKKNNDLVNVIKSRLCDLKDEIEKMSEDEIEIEKLNEIVQIVDEIIDFNNKIQKQLGGGLKILTPDQMLSRLPITLAQLKAGNNSEKLKNEIRQSLYSLYRSKKLLKQLYKSLIDII